MRRAACRGQGAPSGAWSVRGARTASTVRAPRALFDGAGGEPGDEVALEQQESDDHGDAHDE